jgi:putative transposase
LAGITPATGRPLTVHSGNGCGTWNAKRAECAASLAENNIASAPPVTKSVCPDISLSGYYEWHNRPESATTRRRELKQLIRHSFDTSDGTYGYRRVHADLAVA